MTRYKNLSGRSGVLEYEIDTDWIKVRFNEQQVYTYRKTKIGEERFSAMISYAKAGKGLATYISRNVRSDYSSKEK